MNMLLMSSTSLPLVKGEFMVGRVPLSMSFSRFSSGMRLDGTGALENIEMNAPRFDYDPVTNFLRGLLYEPQRTNYIKNSTMIGAIDGKPGTQPTGWGIGLPSGCARSIVIGTENGMSYVDIRLYGSVTASSTSRYISFIGSTEIAALLDEKWTASTYVKLVAGSLSNVSNLGLAIGEFSSGGSWLAGGSSLFTPTDTLARYSYTRTLTNANTTYVQPAIGYSVTAGTSVDFTLRLYQPQMEKGNKATSPVLTSGATVTQAADVLSFTIPNGVSRLRYVFDNDSTQDVAVSAGAYTVPTNLNASHLKRIISL